jgi:hypothetical protein
LAITEISDIPTNENHSYVLMRKYPILFSAFEIFDVTYGSSSLDILCVKLVPL